MEQNYSTMSLVELKKHAKSRRIKQYYIMKRLQLIQLLSLRELPQSFKVEKMTIHELRDEAKRKGVRGFWNLSRGQLVDLLFPTLDENHQDESDTQKHNAPQKHEPEDVGVEYVQNTHDDGA